jgi:hypothetical protein
MAEEKETFVVKKRDVADIIQLRDPDALEIFLSDPIPVISRAIIEFMSHGPVALIGPGVRIVQGALRGELFQQAAKEVKDLQEKGKIDKNFEQRKYGFQSWVELLTVIDEDTPDEDRLDAMKAMFYSANRVNATDGDQILGYQLFQIAKRLSSNELLVLKSAYELSRRRPMPSSAGFIDWARGVSGHLGHNVVSLIEHADRALVDNQLLSERTLPDRSGILYPDKWRLTDLGIKFCENIERYQTDRKGA